ncbi:MAG TPA: peroxidase-related enzyme [Desulfuromonadales bacterium]|nr:peroxidase-related enzyme [Desulfuromonadales bacterium]
MPRIDLPEASNDARVEKIFKEIEGAFGMVPNLFRTYAHFPPLLEANWNKVKAVMMGGNLSRKAKESIAVLISRDNGCDYCVAAHETALRAVGVEAEEIRQIETDLEESTFSSKEKALIELARQANLAPLKMSDEMFQAARSQGASDAEIIEALGVMEVFTAFNKFLDSLQVEIDFERGI